MVDMILKTATKSAMNGAIVNSGLYDPAKTAGSQGGVKGATGWFLNDIGTIYEQTGTSPDSTPIMTARSGYYAMLRWNGGDPEPEFKPNIDVVWRSDDVDAQGNPVPRPAWFMPVLL